MIARRGAPLLSKSFARELRGSFSILDDVLLDVGMFHVARLHRMIFSCVPESRATCRAIVVRRYRADLETVTAPSARSDG